MLGLFARLRRFLAIAMVRGRWFGILLLLTSALNARREGS
jgi:hypothetical protein